MEPQPANPTPAFPSTPASSARTPSPTTPSSPTAPWQTVPPPPAPPKPLPSQEPVFAQTATTTQYATFWQRFLALVIDGLIMGAVGGIIGAIGGLATAFVGGTSESITPTLISAGFIQLFNLLVGFGYPVYFIGSRGQTLGKMALKIKVIKTDPQEKLGYLDAFLRESVGKIISSVVFGLGYFWLLWDDKKQTWHDKIAGTIVIKA